MGLTDELVAALAVPHKDVVIRGVTVRVRGLDAEQLMELDKQQKTDADASFWVLEQTRVSPITGERLFGADDPRLRKLDMAAITELQDAVVSLMGVGERVKN